MKKLKMKLSLKINSYKLKELRNWLKPSRNNKLLKHLLNKLKEHSNKPRKIRLLSISKRRHCRKRFSFKKLD